MQPPGSGQKIRRIVSGQRSQSSHPLTDLHHCRSSQKMLASYTCPRSRAPSACGMSPLFLAFFHQRLCDFKPLIVGTLTQ